MQPILDTDRLRLRPWRDEDHASLGAFYQSDASRFVGGPLSIADSWRRMALFVGHWTLRGFGNWVVEEKTSQIAAGYAGLWQPYGWPEPEIMWILYAGFRGKGYATEAARRAREYAFQDLGWLTAVSYIHEENAPSQRVAARLGARFDATRESPGGNQVWRHLSATCH